MDLHVSEHGSQDHPTLVILHGLFGSSTNWRSIIRALEPRLHILAVDLRNHGESRWHAEMNYPAMADDVAWMIEQRGLDHPMILGHSMGGKVAMTIAQSGLTGVGGLIIADIAPVPYEHNHLEFVDAMLAADVASATSRRDVDQALAARIPESGIRQFLLQNLIRSDDGYFWRINLEAIRSNMSALLDYPDLPSSNVETLFIGGADSSYLAPAVQPELSRQFPTSRIEMVADAGHWLHAEQPGKVLTLIEGFIENA